VRKAFRKWLLRPYIGDAPVDFGFDLSPFDVPQEKEIICLVSRLQNFELLASRMTLRELGLLMDRYYTVIAEAVMGPKETFRNLADQAHACKANGNSWSPVMTDLRIEEYFTRRLQSDFGATSDALPNNVLIISMLSAAAVNRRLSTAVRVSTG